MSSYLLPQANLLGESVNAEQVAVLQRKLQNITAQRQTLEAEIQQVWPPLPTPPASTVCRQCPFALVCACSLPLVCL